MNKRDSQMILSCLLTDGFVVSDGIEDADVVLFNTCSVREHAQNRAIEYAKDVISKKPGAVVGLVGCSVQLLREEVFEKIPGLSFACGPDDTGLMGNIIQRVINGEKNILEVGRNYPDNTSISVNSKVSAFVNIAKGCENFCSYCVVPYARGKLKNRPVQEIVREIKDLTNKGVKEVTLLGQNVSAYKYQECDFTELLKIINKETDIKRIRFLTSHPRDVDEKLLKTIAELPNVCEHIHLPLQSGSDRILTLMNRGYTREYYLKLIEKCKSIIPQCSITTDIIVGFPSEKDTDFKDTISVLKQIRFDGAFVYKYSTRKGTSAYNLSDDVSINDKKSRHRVALDLVSSIAKYNLRKLIGTEQEVLVEKIVKKSIDANIWAKGHTRKNRNIVFPVDRFTPLDSLPYPTRFIPGQIFNVLVKDVHNCTLVGYCL